MNVLILQSSPNEDGLTAACAAAAVEGVQKAGGKAVTIRINDLNLSRCQTCGTGWGTCLTDHACQQIDDFQDLHQSILQADALLLVTPVYWGDFGESAKAVTDRLRRCEATRSTGSLLTGKPFLAVAAAGGSGNGTLTCLASLERWAQHVHARVFDLIPVNRWSRAYKLAAIQSAAECLTRGPEW